MIISLDLLLFCLLPVALPDQSCTNWENCWKYLGVWSGGDTESIVLLLLVMVMLEMIMMLVKVWMVMIRRMLKKWIIKTFIVNIESVFCTNEDGGDRVKLHLVHPEVDHQVEDAAVVGRQEGELQQVLGVKLQLGGNLWAQLWRTMGSGLVLANFESSLFISRWRYIT